MNNRLSPVAQTLILTLLMFLLLTLILILILTLILILILILIPILVLILHGVGCSLLCVFMYGFVVFDGISLLTCVGDPSSHDLGPQGTDSEPPPSTAPVC